MTAPTDQGYHEWLARFPDRQDAGSQHGESSQRFGLRTVMPPQCTVTVGVTDAATGDPIESAYVRLGVYTSYTDGSGIAKALLPKDDYEFVVWKRKRKMHRTRIEISKDEDLKVELDQCKVCNGE
jgi:hypothetical protein